MLLALCLGALGGVMHVLDAEKSLYTIEAFLPENADEDSLAPLRGRLKNYKAVEKVEFVSADSALSDFRRHFSGDMLDLVEGNPIPPFFRLTLVEDCRNPVDLVGVKNALAREGVFDEIQAPVEWVERLAAWKFKMIFWPICIGVLLLVTLSLIISNSVRLSLFSRKLLVENMKYAGGSTLFIQFPFVFEGLMQGFLGSGFAVLLLVLIMESVADSIPMIATHLEAFWMAPLVVPCVTLLSAYFSFRTVRGFLHANRNEQE